MAVRQRKGRWVRAAIAAGFVLAVVGLAPCGAETTDVGTDQAERSGVAPGAGDPTAEGGALAPAPAAQISEPTPTTAPGNDPSSGTAGTSSGQRSFLDPGPNPTPAQSKSSLAENIITVLPKDRIPSIDFPFFIKADEAGSMMADGELVIGVSIDGDHRAYSVPHLSGHEIVNDVVGGRPIAVTW